MNKHLFLAAAIAALAAACGGSQRNGSIGNQGGSKHGPALVFVGWGQGSVFEADCFAAGGTCDEVRATSRAGGELVDGPNRFRLGAPGTDECGASGEVAAVVAVEQLAGEEAGVRIAAYPDNAAVDLVLQRGQWEANAPVAVDDATRTAVAKLATADVANTERARSIAPAELMFRQVVEGNFTGGGAADRLLAVDVPVPDDEGPGYVWSGLVLVTDGALDRATSLWHSDLETFYVDATYDIDGDGQREFIFAADYYEGSSRGSASIKDGKLEFGPTVSCGA